MTERLIPSAEAEICTETFGDARKPAVLLIMGACASMLWWPREFCEQLAARGFFVVRYDNRDTGRSTCYEPGVSGYTMETMVDDAIAVLDAYELPKAHVVGASLGGMLGQLMALRYPERLLSLGLVISGPVAIEASEQLPPIDQKVLNHHAGAGSIDWGNAEMAIDFMTAGWRITAGTRHPFDESLIRELAREEYRRSKSLLSMFNHALLSGGEWAIGKLKNIKAPTLIIHGTEDPVLPFPHAEYLARVIPHARMVALAGMGHELHRLDWKEMMDELQAEFAVGSGKRV